MQQFISSLLLGATLFACPLSAAAESPNTSEQTYSAETVKADLDRLYDRMRAVHPDLYVHREKIDYDSFFAETRAGIKTPMTPFDAKVLFQKFLAYGNVAHARIDFPRAEYEAYIAGGGTIFPIYFRIKEGQVYIAENRSGVDELRPGDRVTKLNGKPIDEWLNRVAANISADTPYMAHAILEMSFPQYLWLEIGEQAEFTVSVDRSDRDLQPFVVPALTPAAQRDFAATQETGFELDSGSREARLLNGKVAYLRPGPFYNAENPDQLWDTTAYETFIDDAFEDFIDQDADRLIIDIRNNPGGDSSFSDLIVAWFADEPFCFFSSFRVKSSEEAAAANAARLADNPDAAKGVSGLYAAYYESVPRGELFSLDLPCTAPRDGLQYEGKVYVLVDRHSFSNAVTMAAMVQDYGFGEIAGEPTSDMATTYGAMETFDLPGTQITVGFPKAHIVRPSGEVQPAGVTPDIVIDMPVTPQETDVVLDALVALIGTE